MPQLLSRKGQSGDARKITSGSQRLHAIARKTLAQWKTWYYYVFHSMGLTTVCVKFPDDDLEILEALEGVEKLKRSDIVRRAVRAYAKGLGLLDADGRPKKTKQRR
ncbi:MAG: hypothetical protein ABI548_06445 [Polyangiaceae bacterium]